MVIPLWLPWAVVVALALPFLLDALTEQAPEGTDPEASPPAPRPPAGGSRAWAQSALLVALVVAGSLTFDRLHVSEDELTDAVDRAASAIDGTAGTEVSDRVAVGVQDRLGRAVDVELVDVEDEDENESSYEVHLEDDPGDPVVCLDVLSVGGLGAVEYAWLTASSGVCESD